MDGNASSTTDSGKVIKLFVLVALDDGQSREDIVEEWRDGGELAEALAPNVYDMWVVGEEKIVMTCQEGDQQVAVTWLSQQSRVRWVEKRPKFVMHNNHAGKAIQSSDGLSTKIWDKGLRGEGQIVGVADTGLDIDMCFFRDASRAVSMCPTDAGTGLLRQSDQASCVNLNHRKVVMYRYFGSITNPSVTRSYDTQGGHGTHVCGSAVGKVGTSEATATQRSVNSVYDGAASGAKLTFDDISSDGNKLDGIPDDLNSGLFPVPYWAGARVHSNSWGSSEQWCACQNSFALPFVEHACCATAAVRWRLPYTCCAA